MSGYLAGGSNWLQPGPPFLTEDSMISRRLKNYNKLILRKTFEFGQRFNINILPCHFYSGIPNFVDLKRNNSWKKPYSMAGIHGAEIANQLNFVKECCTGELTKKLKDRNLHAICCEKNGKEGYGPIETDFLYCFIHAKRPIRILQIGCGVSTAAIMLAASEAAYPPEITCIDPYPTEFIVKSHEEGRLKLIQNKAQLVDIERLTCLGRNDLLFVDSSHTVKAGSEVNKIILEVLPRLEKGTWVHFHDVNLTYDYSRSLLTTELFFPTESILLYSFLINNYKYTLKAALSMLHYAEPQKLKDLLTNYCPSENDYGLGTPKGHFPSSCYLEVVE